MCKFSLKKCRNQQSTLFYLFSFLYIMPNAGSKSQMRLALLVFISCNKLRLAKTVALTQILLVFICLDIQSPTCFDTSLSTKALRKPSIHSVLEYDVNGQTNQMFGSLVATRTVSSSYKVTYRVMYIQSSELLSDIQSIDKHYPRKIY